MRFSDIKIVEMAALTGGNIMSKAVFAANQVANNVKQNIQAPEQKTMASAAKSAARMV